MPWYQYTMYIKCSLLVCVVVFSIYFSVTQVPELHGKKPLILSMQNLADIYLGHITSWNDSAIVQMNPDLKDFLPNQPLLVVYEPGSTSTTLKLSKALEVFPEFNTTVSFGRLFLRPATKTLLGGGGVRCDISSENNRTGCIVDYLWHCDNHLEGSALQLQLLVSVWGSLSKDATSWFTGQSCGQRSWALKGDSFICGLWFRSYCYRPLFRWSFSYLESFLACILGSASNWNTHFTAPGNNSWPIVSYAWFMIYGSTGSKCSDESALNDFIYWTQTSTDAQLIATRWISNCATGSSSGHYLTEIKSLS